MTETFFASITPEQRMAALLYYFGWQGGTIHQLAAETGCKSSDLLYSPWKRNQSYGMSAIRTCDRNWRVNRLAQKHKGDLDYWLDAILGYWITGPLKETA